MTTVPQWLTSNTSIAYPFVDYPEPREVTDLIVDASISDEESGDVEIKITELDLDSGDYTNSSIVLKYSDDSAFFDSGAAPATFKNLLGWITLYWKVGTATVTLMINESKVGDFVYPLSITEGLLVTKTRHRRTGRLNKITVNGQDLQGDIILQQGYNIQIEKLPSKRHGTSLQLSAIPGAGSGKYSDCPPAVGSGIRTINQQPGSDNGEFSLGGDACYWFDRPALPIGGVPVSPYIDQIVAQIDHMLIVRNKCGPCCECSDYVNTYKAMRKLWYRAKAAALGIVAARDDYRALREQWLLIKTAHETGQTSNLRVISHPGYVVSVSVLWYNSSCDLIAGPQNIIGTVTALGSGVTAHYVPKSGYVQATGGYKEQIDPTGLFSFSLNRPLPAIQWIMCSFSVYCQKASESVIRNGTSVEVILGSETKTVTLLPPSNRDIPPP